MMKMNILDMKTALLILGKFYCQGSEAALSLLAKERWRS